MTAVVNIHITYVCNPEDGKVCLPTGAGPQSRSSQACLQNCASLSEEKERLRLERDSALPEAYHDPPNSTRPPSVVSSIMWTDGGRFGGPELLLHLPENAAGRSSNVWASFWALR